MDEDKKSEKRKEIIDVCLNCFFEKELTATTTKDLYMAANLRNGLCLTRSSKRQKRTAAACCAKETVARVIKRLAALFIFAQVRIHAIQPAENKRPNAACIPAVSKEYTRRPT